MNTIESAETFGTPEPVQMAVVGRSFGPAHLEQWARWMRAQGARDRTIINRISIVASFEKRIGIPCATASADNIVTYLQQPWGVATRITYHSALLSYFRWLNAQGLREDNPAALLKPGRVPRGRPRPITIAQLAVLLRTRMHARTRTMILLAAYQGLRVSEIAAMRASSSTCEPTSSESSARAASTATYRCTR